jgi:hypothetical protein
MLLGCGFQPIQSISLFNSAADDVDQLSPFLVLHKQLIQLRPLFSAAYCTYETVGDLIRSIDQLRTFLNAAADAYAVGICFGKVATLKSLRKTCGSIYDILLWARLWLLLKCYPVLCYHTPFSADSLPANLSLARTTSPEAVNASRHIIACVKTLHFYNFSPHQRFLENWN